MTSKKHLSRRSAFAAGELCLSLAFSIIWATTTAIQAQERDWRDISEDVKASTGGRYIPSPLYLKLGYPKTVKSLNLKGTTYTRIVVSWSSEALGTTERQDLLLNCREHSYKQNDGSPGYWYNVQWALPDGARSTTGGALLRHFCKTPSPWPLIAESEDGGAYYTNMQAAYRLKLAGYGETYTFVMAKISKYGFDEMRRLYIACKTRKMAIYSLYDAAGDEGISLDEPNPDSVGEAMVDMACAK